MAWSVCVWSSENSLSACTLRVSGTLAQTHIFRILNYVGIYVHIYYTPTHTFILPHKQMYVHMCMHMHGSA